MLLAPIVLFAFNRVDSLKRTVASLLRNSESADSDLFVFVDGPRETIIGEKECVEEVCTFVKSISGFKSVNYQFSETNKGLGPSVIAGISNVIEQYGRVIVLEDDLILSENFLSFINQSLDYYKDNKRVFSVCGWHARNKALLDYDYDSYSDVRSASWGWATWADRWSSVDWKLDDWKSVSKQSSKFNKWGGSDCYRMLKHWKIGKNQSWAIRFVFSQFVQDKLSVFSKDCLVDNAGFDGLGSNCPKYSRAKWDFVDVTNKTFRFVDDVKLIKPIHKETMKSRRFMVRLFSRIINGILIFQNRL